MQNTEKTWFDFRIIRCADGNDLIDETLKTPYAALNPVQMVEYTEVDNNLAYMRSIERQKHRETERQRKFTYKLFHKVACVCGIM